MESVQFRYVVQVCGNRFPSVSMLTDKPTGHYLEFLDLDMGNRLVRFKLIGDWPIVAVPLENVASMVLEASEPPAVKEQPADTPEPVAEPEEPEAPTAPEPVKVSIMDHKATVRVVEAVAGARGDFTERGPSVLPDAGVTHIAESHPEPEPIKEPEKPQKRKRGRPKGSKNKRKGR